MAVRAGVLLLVGAAGALTLLALLDALDGYVLFAAEGCLLKGQLKHFPQVGALHGGAGVVAAAETAAATAAEATAKDRGEDVAEVEAAEAAAKSAACPEVGVHAREAELVVLGLLVRVGEDFIGLVGLLELVGGLLVPGVHIRVVFFRQLPVGFLDLVRRRALVHAQDLVIVSLILVCHKFTFLRSRAVFFCSGNRSGQRNRPPGKCRNGPPVGRPRCGQISAYFDRNRGDYCWSSSTTS